MDRATAGPPARVARRSGSAQPQDPPSTTVSGVAPAPQASLHVESAEHDIEHEPVQVIVQSEPSLQVTLPLSPTVMTQVEPPEQSRLHESPHEPLQSLEDVQSSEQLACSHDDPLVSQAAPGSQVQLVPVQVGGSAPPPHAVTARDIANVVARARHSDLMGRDRCTRRALRARE